MNRIDSEKDKKSMITTEILAHGGKIGRTGEDPTSLSLSSSSLSMPSSSSSSSSSNGSNIKAGEMREGEVGREGITERETEGRHRAFARHVHQESAGKKDSEEEVSERSLLPQSRHEAWALALSVATGEHLPHSSLPFSWNASSFFSQTEEDVAGLSSATIPEERETTENKNTDVISSSSATRVSDLQTSLSSSSSSSSSVFFSPRGFPSPHGTPSPDRVAQQQETESFLSSRERREERGDRQSEKDAGGGPMPWKTLDESAHQREEGDQEEAIMTAAGDEEEEEQQRKRSIGGGGGTAPEGGLDGGDQMFLSSSSLSRCVEENDGQQRGAKHFSYGREETMTSRERTVEEEAKEEDTASREKRRKDDVMEETKEEGGGASLVSNLLAAAVAAAKAARSPGPVSRHADLGGRGSSGGQENERERKDTREREEGERILHGISATSEGGIIRPLPETDGLRSGKAGGRGGRAEPDKRHLASPRDEVRSRTADTIYFYR